MSAALTSNLGSTPVQITYSPAAAAAGVAFSVSVQFPPNNQLSATVRCPESAESADESADEGVGQSLALWKLLSCWNRHILVCPFNSSCCAPVTLIVSQSLGMATDSLLQAAATGICAYNAIRVLQNYNTSCAYFFHPDRFTSKRYQVSMRDMIMKELRASEYNRHHIYNECNLREFCGACRSHTPPLWR